MVFFLAFLVLTTIVLPVVALWQAGALALSLAFAVMINFGAFATIRHRVAIYFVVGLTIVTFGVNLLAEFGPSNGFATVDFTSASSLLLRLAFGDVHPVTPAARALTMAQALVGQLYIAILVASLVGMALQARSMEGEPTHEPTPSLPV